MISNLESTRRTVHKAVPIKFGTNNFDANCSRLNPSAILSASSIYLNQIWMVENLDKPNKGGVELLSKIKGNSFHAFQ